MNYNKADFIASYGISSQLPESDRPELSFSGRYHQLLRGG